MKMPLALALATLTVVSSGCGENNFGGGSGKSGGSGNAGTTAAQKSEDANPEGGDTTAAMDPPAGATPEQAAIGRCLKAWGQSPFDAKVYDNYRKINAAVTIFGGGGNAVEDTEVTKEPALIVVSASVNVLGTANYVLMNPNGWYCMMVDVNVKARTNIQVQCSAKLADSRVQVNVGSSASPSAAVGVNVLSDVKVERKPSAGSASGC
jgi:hypothetical protein